MKIKLTLEYAGEDFCGWQVQRHSAVLTVQGEIQRALGVFIQSQAKRAGIPAPETPEVRGSGRTDAGVHARGQVASFSWPEDLECSLGRLKQALNAITHPGIIVREIEEVGDEFDARLSPHIKCYSYRVIYRGWQGGHSPHFIPLERQRALSITRPLDVPGMIRAVKLLEGKHDFASFRAADCCAKTTERTMIQAELVRVSDEELQFFFVGKGFLKQMVRIVVGTLIELGSEGDVPERFAEVLRARSRLSAGKTAPACGLTLQWVKYDGKHLL